MKKQAIKYPYLPEGREILHVPADNHFIMMAKKYAKEHSLDSFMPGAAVIVSNNNVIGIGANGSDYHDNNQCERKIRGSKSGEDYELCEGCHPKNHSEISSILDANSKGNSTENADIYLWGHWWCCEPCWKAMISAGIKNVFLLENSEVIFNREVEGNIVGHQFK